jgi:hypothetical protein
LGGTDGGKAWRFAPALLRLLAAPYILFTYLFIYLFIFPCNNSMLFCGEASYGAKNRI